MELSYWGARGFRFSWAKVQCMSRLSSSKNCNPRATGSLHHFMLKVFYAIFKTVPFSVNRSKWWGVQRELRMKWSVCSLPKSTKVFRLYAGSLTTWGEKTVEPTSVFRETLLLKYKPPHKWPDLVDQTQRCAWRGICPSAASSFCQKWSSWFVLS